MASTFVQNDKLITLVIMAFVAIITMPTALYKAEATHCKTFVKKVVNTVNKSLRINHANIEHKIGSFYKKHREVSGFCFCKKVHFSYSSGLFTLGESNNNA
jgi:hypothetical protein